MDYSPGSPELLAFVEAQRKRREYMRAYRAKKRAPDPRDERIRELEAENARLVAALETWRWVMTTAPKVVMEVQESERVMDEAIEGRETPKEAVVHHGAAESFIHFGRSQPAPKPAPRNAGHSRSRSR